jgi:polysaccharide export outer membrane protein
MHVEKKPGFLSNNIFIVSVSLLLFAFGCSNPVAHIPELNKDDFAAARAEPPKPPMADLNYRLLPYDVITIKYTYHPEQDPKAPIAISPDGNIILEGVGSIQAVGLTAEQLGKVIAEKTSARLKSPEVVVTVVQYSPNMIYVGGEVKNPGIVVMQEGMTLVQAIFDRGGFTPTAQMDSVILIRDGASEKPKIGRVNLTQALEDAVREQVTLLNNDVIYVPMTGIGRADMWVKQHIKDLIPWEILRPPSASDVFFR